MKQKAIGMYNFVLKQIKNYVKHNHLLLFFVFSNVLIAAVARIMTLGINGISSVSPFLADTAIVMLIGTLSYGLHQRNRFKYYFVWSLILTGLSFINVVYYGYYTSFTSIQMLQLMNMLGEVSGSLTFNVFKAHQFILLLQPISMFLYYKHLFKKSNHPKELKFKIQQKMDHLYFKQGIIAVGFFFLLFISSLEPKDYSRLVKQWNREYIVGKFGLYAYQINDLVKSVEPKISSMFGYDKAAKTFHEYYDKKTTATNYDNTFAGQNILMIHAESIQDNIIDLAFNGQEVTPNINRLAKEGMYFNNFYAQTSIGTSSDAEFLINTSLLPVSNGTVFISYADRQFDSMPKLLSEKGYYTFSMHANNGTFWNRDVMHKNLGYQKFYDKDYYKIDDMLGLGLADESFFKQSVTRIKKFKQPFYGTMIMLSNHTPFIETGERSTLDLTMKYNDPATNEELVAPYMSTTRLGEYFKSSNYADYTLGVLLSEMDQAGLLENTVVVIYGDHDAKLPKKDYKRMLNYDPVNDQTIDSEDPSYKEYEDYKYELNRNVPFIIWSKNKTMSKKIETTTGMMDVLPILGNLFGFSSKYQMGHDTTKLKDNVVPFPNGNWISNEGYYQKAMSENLIKGFIPFNDSHVTIDYIRKNTTLTETLIDVANATVIYDLQKKETLK